MNAILECKHCKTRWACRGNDDPSTNAFELTGLEQSCPDCGLDDFAIVATEYED